MNRKTLRRVALVTLSLVGISLSTPSSAYEYDAKIVARGNLELQPWDNEGRLPTGDARRIELQTLNQQKNERVARLEATAFTIHVMEQQDPRNARLQSLHTDYQSQVESYERWLESAERRRAAILGQAGNPAMLTKTAMKSMNSSR